MWDRFGFDVCADYSGIFDALSHKNFNVRAAAAEALAAALDENPDKMQVSDQLCKSSVFVLSLLLTEDCVKTTFEHWIKLN